MSYLKKYPIFKDEFITYIHIQTLHEKCMPVLIIKESFYSICKQFHGITECINLITLKHISRHLDHVLLYTGALMAS